MILYLGFLLSRGLSMPLIKAIKEGARYAGFLLHDVFSMCYGIAHAIEMAGDTDSQLSKCSPG